MDPVYFRKNIEIHIKDSRDLACQGISDFARLILQGAARPVISEMLKIAYNEALWRCKSIRSD